MRAIILAAFVGAYAAPAHSQGAAAIPVGVVQAEQQPIAKTLDFVGRVDAINRVEIRARVKGYLEEVLFKEGDLVKEGAAPLSHRKRACFKRRSSRPKARWSAPRRQHELAVRTGSAQAELYAKNVSAGTAVGRSRRVGGSKRRAPS